MAARSAHLLGDLLAVRAALRVSWRKYDADGTMPRRCIVQIVEDTVASASRRRDVLEELAKFLPSAARWSRAQSSIMRFDDAGLIDRPKVLKLVNAAVRANGTVFSILLHAAKDRLALRRANVPSAFVAPAE